MNLVEAEDDSGDSDSSGDLHSIFQIGNQSQEIFSYCEYKWGTS